MKIIILLLLLCNAIFLFFRLTLIILSANGPTTHSPSLRNSRIPTPRTRKISCYLAVRTLNLFAQKTNFRLITWCTPTAVRSRFAIILIRYVKNRSESILAIADANLPTLMQCIWSFTLIINSGRRGGQSTHF